MSKAAASSRDLFAKLDDELKKRPIKGEKRHPDIEDHVTIYAHATILGGTTRIGAHSVVGASVWLMDSIPPHSIAYYKDTDLVLQLHFPPTGKPETVQASVGLYFTAQAPDPPRRNLEPAQVEAGQAIAADRFAEFRAARLAHGEDPV